MNNLYIVLCETTVECPLLDKKKSLIENEQTKLILDDYS